MTGHVVPGIRLGVGPVQLRVANRPLVVGLIALGLLATISVLSLMHGTLTVAATEVIEALFGNGEDRVVRTVQGRRLPRLLTALLVGGGLGAAGSVFQSVSRNPLGSPDIIGFTAGAAAAAVTQVVIFGGGRFSTALASLLGGGAAAMAVYLLARRDGVSAGDRLVLVGIGIGSMCSAVTSLMVLRAEVESAIEAQEWLAGSLLARDWIHVKALTAATIVLLPILATLARRLTMIEMGDDLAAGIGIDVERVRFRTVVVGVLLSGASVAATGPIAFVALAAPQIASRISRHNGVQLFNSWLLGATLLAAADLLSRVVNIGLRLPVGTVTALLGGVYLIWLLGRRA